MTWKQLGRFISDMPQEQINGPVRFLEPYDDGREGYVLEAIMAEEDIYLASQPEKAPFVKAGEPFLG